MTTALVAFVVALLAGAVMTALMLRLAPLVGAVDRPDGYRKIHATAVPRLGGVGVFAGFLTPIIVLLAGFRDNEILRLVLQDLPAFAVMVAGALVALLMGIRDDIRPLRPRVKLLLQTIAAVVAMAGGHVIWRLSLPWIGEVEMGLWGVPLTLFWFLGCMNAINLLDGMDGLAGGVSFIVCVTLMLVGQIMGNHIGVLLMGCLGGGILGFLIFNFNPARIFLGDSGSNVIGFLIAALAIMTSRKSETTVALLIPVIAMGLPITDTALAIVRRWSRGLPLSAPDRQHIHHLLLALGLSQRRAVLLIYGICVALCAGAVLSISEARELLMMVFGAMGVMVFVCVRILGAFQLGDLRLRLTHDWLCHEAGNQARIEVERCAHFLPRADTTEALWAGCAPALSVLAVDEARLTLTGNPACGRELLWRSPAFPDGLAAQTESWRVRLDLMAEGHPLGHLTVAGAIAAGRLFVPERLDLLWRLRDLLAAQLPRILTPHASSASPAQSKET